MSLKRQFVNGVHPIVAWIKERIRCIADLVKVIGINTPEYKFTIEAIELKRTATDNAVFIHYRTVGCRVVRRSSAQELNTSDLFASFRPADAQKIVSIATIEALLNKRPDIIQDKFVRYVELCASKCRK